MKALNEQIRSTNIFKLWCSRVELTFSSNTELYAIRRTPTPAALFIAN